MGTFVVGLALGNRVGFFVGRLDVGFDDVGLSVGFAVVGFSDVGIRVGFIVG